MGKPDGISIMAFAFATCIEGPPGPWSRRATASAWEDSSAKKQETDLTHTSSPVSISLWGTSLQQEGAYSKEEQLLQTQESPISKVRGPWLGWHVRSTQHLCSALLPCVSCVCSGSLKKCETVSVSLGPHPPRASLNYPPDAHVQISLGWASRSATS